MKKTLAMPVIIAALFAFVFVGCTAPEIEEPALPQEPETEQELTLEEKRARFEAFMATRAGNAEIMELTVQPGRLNIMLGARNEDGYWHQFQTPPLDHLIMSWNSNTIFEELTNGHDIDLNVTFTREDVVYMIGDRDITFGIELSGSAVKDIKFFDSGVTSFRTKDSPNITSLDLTELTSLARFYIRSCSLPSIDLSNNTNLKGIDWYYNELTDETLDLSANIKLERIHVEHWIMGPSPGPVLIPTVTCPVTADSLKHLMLGAVPVPQDNIDFSVYPNLEYLRILYSDLGHVDLSHNNKLSFIQMGSNGTSEIILPNNLTATQGKYYFAANQLVTSFDVSRLKGAHTINLQNCPVTELDFSSLTDLQDVDISNTRLSGMNLLRAVNSLPDRTGMEPGAIMITNPPINIVTLLNNKNWQVTH